LVENLIIILHFLLNFIVTIEDTKVNSFPSIFIRFYINYNFKPTPWKIINKVYTTIIMGILDAMREIWSG